MHSFINKIRYCYYNANENWLIAALFCMSIMLVGYYHLSRGSYVSLNLPAAFVVTDELNEHFASQGNLNDWYLLVGEYRVTKIVCRNYRCSFTDLYEKTLSTDYAYQHLLLLYPADDPTKRLIAEFDDEKILDKKSIIQESIAVVAGALAVAEECRCLI
ncbi:hypothetical protein I3271_07310 [Photobacterium leiognathi]|uniref:hypothetical protein n=1 Tax=Photobacterium leiognathi TaxID=553611 RepID=UPI001EDFF314|nr:hypothetical protein [Photobacterium leiognathi]MCG3884493.1 hypothetical protein [Photobacterium leiognathi]